MDGTLNNVRLVCEPQIVIKRMILKSQFYKFHRVDLTRQAGFIVTVYDEDELRLAATMQFSDPAEAFAEGRRIVDNKVPGPTRQIP